MVTGGSSFVLALALFWAGSVAALVVTGRMVWRHPGGLWIQVAVAWLAANTFTLLAPTNSLAVMVLTGVSLLVLPLLGLWRNRHSGPGIAQPRGLLVVGNLVVLVAFIVVLLGLAVVATGAVASFDAGLYHLSAIEQSRQIGVVPGIANLYYPYGYHNSYFPFTALVSAFTGSDQGFRAVNGLLLLLMAVDVWQRFRAREQRPGTIVVAIGLPIVLILTMPFATFWITSPTPDTAVFILFIIASAYFVDAIATQSRTDLWRLLSLACALGAIVATIRPLYLITLVAMFTLGSIRARTLPASMQLGNLPWIPVALGVATIAVGLVRDVIHSGWLWYPLGMLPIPVPWIAENPGAVRALALNFNRWAYAVEDFAQAESGWSWIPAWFAIYLPSNIGTIALWLLLFGLAVLAMLLTLRHHTLRQQVRGLALVLTPSLITLVAWSFFTPPALRFAWGPLFAIPIMSIAWWARLGRLSNTSAIKLAAPVSMIVSMAVVAVATTSFLTNQSDSPSEHTTLLGIQGSVSAVPEAELIPVPLGSGAIIYAPDGPTFQCWGEPFCTAELTPGLDSRSLNLQDGFTRLS